MKMKSPPALLVGFGLGFAAALALAASTHSSYYLTNADFDRACVLANGEGFKATIVEQSAIGWRCYNASNGQWTSVNVQGYCTITRRGSVSKWDVNFPLGWYCGT